MTVCTTCSREIADGAAFCSHCGSPNPDATPLAESDADALRRRLQAALGADFTVETMLGEGGFAVVFAVFDRKLSRRIAVKVLRPELTASRSSKQRFIREAESVARLNHPHILPIFFVGDAPGLVWFGMPLVDGETLDARLRRDGRLSETEAARIGAEVADALAEAHATGLVHRDIKPLNIMLHGSRGRVLVADFGIAKAAAGSGEQLTATGVAIGSPHYMSPEQACGAEQVDQRSDIYTMGIVLWQALAGGLPFEAAESRAVLMQQMTRPLPRLRERRPDLSAAMAAVVEKCTEKEPRDRYQSADEVAHALRAIAAGAPAHAGRGPDTRTLVVAAAGLAAVATLGAVGFWQSVDRRDADPQSAAAETAAPVTAGPVIAVLPFSVVGSGDTAQFARAAALMLSEALAVRNGVSTVDGNDLLGRWIGEGLRNAAPLDDRARFAYRLGANQMIVGNYVEAGTTFRLAATMYDTHTATRVWSDEVTGSTDSLFGLIDRLAARAATALCGQPAYNPADLCYDAPARPGAPLAVNGTAADTAPSFFARVSAAGEVLDVRIRRASAEASLASRALEALQAARFEPARKGGRAVDAWTTVDVAIAVTDQLAAAPRTAAAPGAPPAGAVSACDDPATGARNPGGTCFDARPVPTTRLPVLRPPSTCGRAPSAVTVLVHVGTEGTVLGRPEVTAASDCGAFTEAALAAASQIGFAPALKNGRPVAAWTLILVRPAVATAAAVVGGTD